MPLASSIHRLSSATLDRDNNRVGASCWRPCRHWTFLNKLLCLKTIAPRDRKSYTLSCLFIALQTKMWTENVVGSLYRFVDYLFPKITVSTASVIKVSRISIFVCLSDKRTHSATTCFIKFAGRGRGRNTRQFAGTKSKDICQHKLHTMHACFAVFCDVCI